MKYRSTIFEGGPGSGIKGHKPGDPTRSGVRQEPEHAQAHADMANHLMSQGYQHVKSTNHSNSAMGGKSHVFQHPSGKSVRLYTPGRGPEAGVTNYAAFDHRGYAAGEGRHVDDLKKHTGS